MGVSYLRSKLHILIKFASHRHAPLSKYHSRFNFLPQHFVNSVHRYRPIHTYQRISDGIRHYHGNRTTELARRNVWDIVLSSDLGTGIPFRKSRFIKTGLAILGTVLFGRLERIPYSDRYHLVFSCKTIEKYLGKLALRMQNKEKLLPSDDKQSIRVRKVLENIVGTLNADLSLKKEGYVVFQDTWSGDDKVEKMTENYLLRETKEYSKERSMKILGNKNGPFGTKHLEGLKWEVRVVDSYTVNAFYTTRGKIVVYSGLLEKLKSDEELAAVLAHEVWSPRISGLKIKIAIHWFKEHNPLPRDISTLVGHGVAQHITDHLMKVLLIFIIAAFLQVQHPEHLTEPLFCYLSRRKEMEADYIGLMLMASAGYDPRTAPKVFEERLGDSDDSSLFDTHPTGKKRANKLRQPKVMGKAVAIYKDVKPEKLSLSF